MGDEAGRGQGAALPLRRVVSQMDRTSPCDVAHNTLWTAARCGVTGVTALPGRRRLHCDRRDLTLHAMLSDEVPMVR